MGSYLYNIWLALCGRDILERERREARREQKESDDRDVQSYQTLVENLRERVGDLEERIAEADRQHRQEMADLHACYKEQITALHKQVSNK